MGWFSFMMWMDAEDRTRAARPRPPRLAPLCGPPEPTPLRVRVLFVVASFMMVAIAVSLLFWPGSTRSLATLAFLPMGCLVGVLARTESVG